MTTAWMRRRHRPAKAARHAMSVPALLVTVTVLAQIAYPLTPAASQARLTAAIVLVAAAAAFVHAATTTGGRGATTLLGVGVLAGVSEVIGLRTGQPFGTYVYSSTLGPGVFGVPWLVVAAWTSMAWPAAVVARRIARRWWARVLVGAWALAAWDVFLDPQMVAAGRWSWTDVTAHLPGIDNVPLSNFVGWLGVSLLVSALLQTAPIFGSGASARPMVAYYVWTAVSSALAAAAFWGRPAVAVWGLLAMGPVAVAAVRDRAHSPGRVRSYAPRPERAPRTPQSQRS